MSKAPSEGQDRPRRRKPQGDRRDHTAPRLQYEALVEVGANATGGFEAESVDVSLDGMRLRTAYLPRIGERMVCRFDGFGGEIVAKGEVVWCEDQGRGGDFGIRFTNLDDQAALLLEDLCDLPEDEEEPPPEPSSKGASPGSRVRLHIQGLGSPMRARVRETAKGEVLIGSNLEFLKVGRGVELEDIERGRKRTARIEHVGVDVDPESAVPQLVVALTYDLDDRAPMPPAEERVNEAPKKRAPGKALVGKAGRAPAPERVARERVEKAMVGEPLEDEDLTTAPFRVRRDDEITPEPQVIDSDPEPTPSFGRASLSLSRSAAPARVAHVPPPAYDDDVAEAEEPGEELEPPATLQAGEEPFADDEREETAEEASEEEAADALPLVPTVGERMGALAQRLAPTLRSAGEGAKGAFGGAKGALGKVLATVRDKREARKQTQGKDKGPKRRTAPPPSGALRSEGKRLVRDRKAVKAEAVEEAPPPPKNDRKRTVFSGMIGLMAVLAIYFVSNHFADPDVEADPAVAEAEADAEDGAAAAQAPAAAAVAPAAVAGQAGEVATAEVPLFGATPLSTTEVVPVPPAPGETADDSDEGGEDEGEGVAEPSADFGKLVKEWGVGDVIEPNVLRLKMDGRIDGIVGKETATGFTIIVPGHKSISSAAGFKRRDKRLDEVKVVNYPDRVEVTMLFRKDVPAFVARAKGKRLVIELGTKTKRKKKD